MSYNFTLNIPTKSSPCYKSTQLPIHFEEDHGLQGTLAVALIDCPADDGLAHTEYYASQPFVSEAKSFVESADLFNWQLLFKTINNPETSKLNNLSTSCELLLDSSALSTPSSVMESSKHEHTDNPDKEQALHSPDYFSIVSPAHTEDTLTTTLESQPSSLSILNSNLYIKFPTDLTPPYTSNNKSSKGAAVNFGLWSDTFNSVGRCKTLAEMSPMQIEAFLQHYDTLEASSNQQLRNQMTSTYTDKQQSNADINCKTLNCEYSTLSCKDFLDRVADGPTSPSMARCDGGMTNALIDRLNSRIVGNSYAAKANPPRPPNAFILFRCEHQREMQQMHPDKTMQEISKMLGDIWNQQPANSELKQRFKRLAAAEREAHKKIWPNYKYTCGKRRVRAKNRKLAS